MQSPLDRLHATDYYAWMKEQAVILLRLAAGRTDLDLDHLGEEVEDLGKTERRAILSQMRRLQEHLLQLQFSSAEEPHAS